MFPRAGRRSSPAGRAGADFLVSPVGGGHFVAVRAHAQQEDCRAYDAHGGSDCPHQVAAGRCPGVVAGGVLEDAVPHNGADEEL